MNNQSRLKSYVLWAAVAAFIIDCLIFGGAITVSQSEKITFLVQRFLELLTLAGIINNPTNKSNL
jgi:uncharacterized membrane protein